MGKVKSVGGKDYTQDAQGNWYEVESPVQKEDLKMKVVNGVTYQKDADGNWFTRDEVKKKVGGEDSGMPSQSKSTSELLSTETGINFNELNAMKGGSNRATPQQKDIVQYGENVSKGAVEKHEKDIDDAVNNTAKLYFENNPSLLKSYSLSNRKATGDKFSLTQLRSISPYQLKVAELKNKIASGEYGIYSSNTGEKRVQRKTGDWDNFKAGVSEAWNANKKVDEYLGMSKEQKIKFLNEFKPDMEYLPERPDAGSGLYQVGAAVPSTGKMIGAAATGAVMSAAIPETGGLSTAGLPAVLAWASVVPDMAKQNQMSAEIEAYHEAKKANPNLSDEDALKIANNAGTIGYASGLAKGTLMNVVGQGSLPPNTGQGLLKATGQFLKNQPQSVAEIGGLSLGISGAETLGKKAIGLDEKDWATKAGEVLNADAIGQLAFNVAFGIAAAPKYVKAQANEVLSKMDTEALQMIQQRAIEEGLITEQQANDANKDLQDYKAAKAKVPPMDSEEKTAVIAGLIQKKQNLEKAKTEMDKSFHDELDAQIEAADQRIQLAKKSNDPIKYAEQDDLDGTKNFTPKSFENLSKKEVEGIAEEVPKEYGEAKAIEVGGDAEGSAKKYKAEATVIRQQGFIKIKDKIAVDDKVYNDKADAEAAAQKALAQHYYENAMDETLKPEQKSSVTVIRPEQNKAPEIVESKSVIEEPVSSVENEKAKAGSVGVGGDGFKQAGEKARDTKDATHIGRWMLDNSQKGDVVRFQDGGYEVTEVNTKKDGTKELVLTPFEFNEDGSKDYNNSGIKIITEQSIKNGSNLFENAYTNSKGERVIEQSTYEPAEQSLKETPKAETSKNETQTEKPIQQTMEGSGTGNEPIAAEKTSVTETIVPETTRPIGEEQSAPEKPEIVKLKQERDGRIKSIVKPKAKLELVSTDDLVNSAEPIKNKEIHDGIKNRYKKLRQLIDCL